MKYLYILTFNYRFIADRFFNYLESIKDQIELLTIQYVPYYIPLKSEYRLHRGYPGNFSRFLDIPYVDDKKYVIFSDVYNVVWQRQLPNFYYTTYDAILGNTNTTFSQVELFRKYIDKFKIFDELKQKIIYDAGLFILKGDYFNKLLFFYKSVHGKYGSYKYEVEKLDTLFFNKFIYEHPELNIYNELDIIAPLFNNENFLTFEKTINYRHLPVAVVHANNKTNELLNKVYPPPPPPAYRNIKEENKSNDDNLSVKAVNDIKNTEEPPRNIKLEVNDEGKILK